MATKVSMVLGKPGEKYGLQMPKAKAIQRPALFADDDGEETVNEQLLREAQNNKKRKQVRAAPWR